MAMTLQQINQLLAVDPKFQELRKKAAESVAAAGGGAGTYDPNANAAMQDYAAKIAQANGYNPGMGGSGTGDRTNLYSDGQYHTQQDASGWQNGLVPALAPLIAGTGGIAAGAFLGGAGGAAAGGGSAAGGGAAGAGVTGGAGAGGAAGAAGGSGVGGIFGAATGPIISSGIGATANLYGAKKQSDAAKEASDAQIAAANHAADLQKQAADAALKFQQDQAAQNRADYITAQNASYGQYGYRQNVIRPTQQNGLNATNSLAQMLGLPQINARLPDLPPPPQFGPPPQTLGQQIGGPPPPNG